MNDKNWDEEHQNNKSYKRKKKLYICDYKNNSLKKI